MACVVPYRFCPQFASNRFRCCQGSKNCKPHMVCTVLSLFLLTLSPAYPLVTVVGSVLFNNDESELVASYPWDLEACMLQYTYMYMYRLRLSYISVAYYKDAPYRSVFRDDCCLYTTTYTA